MLVPRGACLISPNGLQATGTSTVQYVLRKSCVEIVDVIGLKYVLAVVVDLIRKRKERSGSWLGRTKAIIEFCTININRWIIFTQKSSVYVHHQDLYYIP